MSRTTDAVGRGAGVARAPALFIAATIAALLSCGALAGCATTTTTTTNSSSSPHRPDVRRHVFVEEGRASYYGSVFNGRPTASGERYDPEQMTAAHKTLPFGTWLRVTRADGRSIEVRVTDRCGCGGGHIVDLSRAAARRLEMLRAGTVWVRVEVIAK